MSFFGVVQNILTHKYFLDKSSISILKPKDAQMSLRNNLDVERFVLQIDLGENKEQEQKISIEICNVPSYNNCLKIIPNFKAELGNYSIPIHVEAEEEVFGDKLVSLIFRNNGQYRDIYDLYWLNTRYHLDAINNDIFMRKMDDYRISADKFIEHLEMKRNRLISEDSLAEFKKEISRVVTKTVCEKMFSFKIADEMIKFYLKKLDECQSIAQD